MKAYAVSNDEGGVIVFHESAGKAKQYALHRCEWFESNEFIELSAHRVPAADKYASEFPRELGFCEHSDIYHALGWVCFYSGDCDSYSCQFKKDEDAPLETVEEKQASA